MRKESHAKARSCLQVATKSNWKCSPLDTKPSSLFLIISSQSWNPLYEGKPSQSTTCSNHSLTFGVQKPGINFGAKRKLPPCRIQCILSTQYLARLDLPVLIAVKFFSSSKAKKYNCKHSPQGFQECLHTSQTSCGKAEKWQLVSREVFYTLMKKSC